MSLYAKLILREAAVHRVRLTLALLAIIATSCMVVWLIGGFDQLAAQKKDSAENYLGNYQLVLSPPDGELGPGFGMGGPGSGKPGMGPGGPGSDKPGRPGGRPGMAKAFSPEIFGLLRNDDDIAAVHSAMQCFGVQSAIVSPDFSVYDRIRQGMGTPVGSALIVGIDTTSSPFALEEGRWFDTVVTGYPKDSDLTLECVVGSEALRQMQPLGFGANSGKSAKSAGKKAKSAPAQVGSKVQFYFNGVETQANIVGMFHQGLDSSSGMPRRGAPGSAIGPGASKPKPVSITRGAIYMPLGAAARVAGIAPRTDLVYIRLKDGAEVKAVRERLEKIFAEKKINLLFQDISDVRESLVGNQSANAILGQAYASIGLVLVASIFIIFTTLSMGVNERTRQLALLRCIGLSRRQIVCLILGESLLLGVFGCIGGAFAGYGLLWAGQVFNGHKAVVVLSPLCLGVTAVCSITGALFASIIPAWRAARIKPIDALQQASAIPSHKWAIPCAVVGAVLVAVCPTIVYGGLVSGAMQRTIYGSVGLVAMSIGFLLLIPALVLIAEKIFSPLAAWTFGMKPIFLQGQLSRNLWRSVGTVISVSVGLGLYCFFEIWGYSMLVPFTPTRHMPDALVAFFPKGVSDADVAKVQACPAVNSDQFMALQVEHAKLTPDQQERIAPTPKGKKTGNKPTQDRNSGMGMNDNMVIMGVDIEKSFDGKDPMLTFPFAEGTRTEAIKKLKSDKRYCLLTDAFAVPYNIHVGDTLEFEVPDPNIGRGTFAGLPANLGMTSSGIVNSTEAKSTPTESTPTGEKPTGEKSGKEKPTAKKTVTYEVAGVLSFTGYQWMVKTSGLRFRQGRGSLMICRDDLVWQSFETPQADRNRFFWFNKKADNTLSDEEITSYMVKIAENQASAGSGVAAADGSGADSESAPRSGSRAVSETGSPTAVVEEGKGFAKVSTIESLTAFLNQRADSVIQSMAKMPLMILVITTIAVINTMVASVRTRRWEIGLLRCVSLTRSQVVRMVLAESLLLALVACFVSLSLGTMAAWCSIGVSSTGAFGAVNVPLVLPWSKLSVGLGLTLGLCLIASVWTAFRAAAEEPARLLVSN